MAHPQGPASLGPFLKDVEEEILRILHRGVLETGPLGEMSREHFKAPGKLLRPKITYLLGQQLGVSRPKLLPWATSCELFHNATLIHDDLQDGDEFRRGRPTLWKHYGPAQAINAGDLLIALAFGALSSAQALGPQEVKNLQGPLTSLVISVIHGQALDLALRKGPLGLGPEQDYLECVARKTGDFFSHMASGVCRLSGLSQGDTHGLERAFQSYGVLFQLQDDVLDLYGDKGRGERGGDIREGKMSILVATHLKEFPEDAEAIEKILTAPRQETSSAHVEWMAQLFQQKGTLPRVLKRIDKMAHQLQSQTYVGQFVDSLLAPIGHLF